MMQYLRCFISGIWKYFLVFKLSDTWSVTFLSKMFLTLCISNFNHYTWSIPVYISYKDTCSIAIYNLYHDIPGISWYRWYIAILHVSDGKMKVALYRKKKKKHSKNLVQFRKLLNRWIEQMWCSQLLKRFSSLF